MRFKRFLAALAVATAMVTMPGSPASAHTGGPPNESLDCWTYNGYYAICWEFSGDDIWVRDLFSDGESGYVTWETSYGRVGYCRNAHGHLTWHECLEDVREDTSIRFTYYTFDQETGTVDWVFGPTNWVSTS